MTTVAGPQKIRTCCLSLHNFGSWRRNLSSTVLCKTQCILSTLDVAVKCKKTWLMNTDTLVYCCQKQTLPVGRKETVFPLPQRNVPCFCPGTIPQIQMTNSFSSKSPLLCSLALGQTASFVILLLLSLSQISAVLAKSSDYKAEILSPEGNTARVCANERKTYIWAVSLHKLGKFVFSSPQYNPVWSSCLCHSHPLTQHQ